MNHTYHALVLMSCIASSISYSAESSEKKIEINAEESSKPPEEKVKVVETRTPLFSKAFALATSTGEESYLTRLSPDQRTIMQASYNNNEPNTHYVRLYDTSSGLPTLIESKEKLTFKNTIIDAAWSPDSAFLATTTAQSPAQVSRILQSPHEPVYNNTSYCTESGDYLYALTSPSRLMQASFIIVSHKKNDSKNYCVDGMRSGEPGEISTPMAKSCFWDNNKLIAVYTPDTHCVKNVENPHTTGSSIQLNSYQDVTAADFSEKRHIFGFATGSVRIFEPKNLQMVVRQAFFNQTISRIASASQHFAVLSGKHIKIMSYLTGQVSSSFIHTHIKLPELMSIHPSGELLAYSAGRAVSILDIKTQESVVVHKELCDCEPTSIGFGAQGLIITTPKSITKLVPTDKKERQPRKEAAFFNFS